MYISTRNKTTVTASKAIINGLAENSGLYIITDINSNFFDRKLLAYDYNKLSKAIFHEFLDDYTEKSISDIIESCYQDNFHPNIVNLKHFKDFSLLELFKGETFAFKDMALSILPSLFNEAKKINKIDDKTIILTATSGDTGSAALSGFGKIENTFVIVLYPKHGVSEFQELQMNKHANKNCLIFGIDGNFDDCQNIAKKLFRNIKTKHSILSSANSINIGRIIPQIIYYFYAYFKLVKEMKIDFGEEVNYTVPTGNFGNIYAGFLAKEMGLPIYKLIIASNSNNVLTGLFNNHKYNINRVLQKTISPSMDILISSNFERYLYHMTQSHKKVEKYMKQLQENKSIYIEELEHQNTFEAYDASEKDTKEAIKSFYLEYNYTIDPHTAVAYDCFNKYKKENQDQLYNIILSTASPYKFSESVLNALTIKAPKLLSEQIDLLKSMSINNYDPRVEEVLISKINSRVISLDLAYEYIKKVIGDIDDKN